VLQLFSIGLYELNASGQALPIDNPTPAYSQQTVEDFAKVFTGWNFANTDQWNSVDLTPFDKITAMVPVEQFHDSSSKTLLNGIVVEAGLSAREDLTRALDNIFNHSNVGPFIARHLIQRLVSSNPSPEYVARAAAVFNDNGNGERGDLGALTKAILLDPEAAASPLASNAGKLKEPVFKLSHLLRAFNAQPGATSDGVYHGAARTADRVDEVYGQAVMSSPSVFNFFSPTHPSSSRSQDSTGNTKLEQLEPLQYRSNRQSACSLKTH